MTNNNDKISELLAKLDTLLEKQENFSKEINQLRIEINHLKQTETAANISQAQTSEKSTITEPAKEQAVVVETVSDKKASEVLPQAKNINQPPSTKLDIEKLIGENLISKIGIAITVIGVSIGAKYSIEHDLISPLTRIILGYLIGIGLMGFGIKLKHKYENFSAVLVSGSMAIMYFITYSAYGIYDLIPNMLAFALMLVFTVFTVIAAVSYNKPVIAHIGLVGAYAVPFLLSEGSGKIAILFSYITIINCGILILSFKKYWKSLYYSSFGLTWLIYFSWYSVSYETSKHFSIALAYLTVFFILFYVVFLAYKLLKKEKFEAGDIVLLLLNSFIFYGFGFSILSSHKTGENLLGLFTLLNAITHFTISAIIYKQKLADKNLFYLVSGLVLVFITITIPVQLDGNWVTLLWAGEAALLFWIGRSKKVDIYEKISYVLMLLSFFSILEDWGTFYNGYYPESASDRITPLLNIQFISSLLFIAAFGFINSINRSKEFVSIKDLSKTMSFTIPAILVFSIYQTFRLEIESYYNQLYKISEIIITTDENEVYYMNYDLKSFKSIWIINYSLLFVSLLSLVNISKLKNQLFGYFNLGLILVSLFVFLTQGLYEISELRESYLNQSLSEYYQKSSFNLWIRYISLAFVFTALFSAYKYIHQEFMQRNFKMGFDFLLHASLLWIASSELIHWMDISKFGQSYKLGLSILWGIYSLLLIVLGIWKGKKYLRIGAMSVFGVTLIKLFFYDISHLDTIAKTIVFVSLGILLLIISFLYNKYKHIISNEN
jgi:uncharacterized membrane protein